MNIGFKLLFGEEAQNNMAEENGHENNANVIEATTSNIHEKEEKSSTKNENQPASGKKADDQKVSFYKLFTFADNFDNFLMSAGTIGAVANGLCMPLMTILFGELIDSFGSNQNNKDIVSVVSKVILILLD